MTLSIAEIIYHYREMNERIWHIHRMMTGDNWSTWKKPVPLLLCPS